MPARIKRVLIDRSPISGDVQLSSHILRCGTWNGCQKAHIGIGVILTSPCHIKRHLHSIGIILDVQVLDCDIRA
jgi:hypothetical protein